MSHAAVDYRLMAIIHEIVQDHSHEIVLTGERMRQALAATAGTFLPPLDIEQAMQTLKQIRIVRTDFPSIHATARALGRDWYYEQ